VRYGLHLRFRSDGLMVDADDSHQPLSAFLYPQNGIDTLLTSDEVYHNYVKVNVHYTKPNRDA
jgi:hypothetical protein